MNDIIIKASNLSKSYKKGIGIKRFYGLKTLSLDIIQGEVLGVIGPNGAGKTTTFKLMLGLIKPDQGTIEFGSALHIDGSDPKSKIGFLPENPYFYSYLSVEESLDFYARLFNMKQVERKKRVDALLSLVGLDFVRKRQLGKLSRGMLQRVGIAQAIINDPELLILDEPMSGLDPIGRKEIRDIIIDYAKRGKTVIFSSHILSDVEMICDRVVMIAGGELKAVGQMESIFGQDTLEWEVEYSGPEIDFSRLDTAESFQTERKGEKCIVKIYRESLIFKVIEEIGAAGGKLISFNQKKMELEKLYLSQATVKHDA